MSPADGTGPEALAAALDGLRTGRPPPMRGPSPWPVRLGPGPSVRGPWPPALAVDGHPTMAIWAERVALLRAALQGRSALPVPLVRLDRESPPPATAILVITDGAGPQWRDGRAAQVLARWAEHASVAVAHVLPEPRWHLSGISARPLVFHPAERGRPNAARRWPSSSGPGIPIPVLELHGRWLDRWVRTVGGPQPGHLHLPGLLVGRRPTWGRAAPAAGPHPVALVAEFRAAASPEAFDLATYLSATVLDVPAMLLIRERMLPRGTTSDLAQVLAGRLVTGTGPPGRPLDFAPGVREILLSGLLRIDLLRVAHLVMQATGSGSGAARLSAALRAPDTTAVPTVQELAGDRDALGWTVVESTVLHALSGRHLKRARALDAVLERLHDNDSPEQGRSTGPLPQQSDSARIRFQTPVPRRDAKVLAEHDESPAGDPSAPNRQGAPMAMPIPESDASVRRPGQIPAVWGTNVPLRNPNFTGREELLEQLHDRLRRGMAAVLPHALHGMGGVGKSQLAVEYLYRHMDEYDVVWWISAEQTTRVASSLVDLSIRLGLQAGNEAGTAVPAVLEALRKGVPYSRWLLVFDNAESPELVSSFFPSGGSGSILVTSRDAQWNQVAMSLEVNVFKREESKELLRVRSPELSDDDADRMAEALGDLPLAIEQAAAWRAETGMPADEYLQLLEEKRADLLEVSTTLDYQMPVIAAWNVSLDRLQVKNPAALQLLQLCSSFAAEPIARSILARGRGTDVLAELDLAMRDPIRFSRAIRDISRYSLARIDHRTTSIQMHRLVKAALISRMTHEERENVRHAAHVVLAESDPNDPENLVHWPLYGELFPHLFASDAHDCQDSRVRELVINEVRYLAEWGDYKAGEELARRALNHWRQNLGPDDVQTLKMSVRLAFLLFLLGRYSEAAELNAEVLSQRREIMGEEHEDTIFARSMVSGDRRVQGEFRDALELSRVVHQQSLRILGTDDPETLNAAHNLAVSLRLTGLFAEAAALDSKTWQSKVRMYGTEHGLSLLTRLGLLIDERELGGYLSAPALHEEVLSQCQTLLGPSNRVTLQASRLLAVARRKAGQHEAARAMSEEIFENLFRRYGEQHPEVLASELELTVNLRQTDDLEGARTRGTAVLARYSKTFGEQHPHTMSARANLAVTLRLLGDVSGAHDIDSEIYQAFDQRLGPDHPLTLIVATNLASDRFALGDVQGAHDLDAATAERSAAVLGADHPSTLVCLTNLAIDLRALGRVEEAERIHENAAGRLVTVLGAEHPGTVEAIDWDRRANSDIDPMPL